MQSISANDSFKLIVIIVNVLTTIMIIMQYLMLKESILYDLKLYTYHNLPEEHANKLKEVI